MRDIRCLYRSIRFRLICIFGRFFVHLTWLCPVDVFVPLNICFDTQPNMESGPTSVVPNRILSLGSDLLLFTLSILDDPRDLLCLRMVGPLILMWRFQRY